MSGAPALEGRATGSDEADPVGWLAVLFSAACWGTSALFVKLIGAEQSVSALALAFWRDITTATVLLIGLGLLRPDLLRIDRRDLRWFLGLGISLGIFHVCWNLGVFLSGAAVATVQQAAMPAIVTVAAWFLWHEPLSGAKIAAISLTFAGTVLVSGLDVLGQIDLSPGSLLIGLSIPVTYASWNLFGKRVRQTYGSLTTLTYAFAFGALVLAPFQLSTPQPWPVLPKVGLWFAGLIALSTLIPFSVYAAALGRLPASVATILAMSEIAFVALYAYILLGERLTTSQILGTGLVVGGVVLLSWPRRRNRGPR